MTKSMKNTNGMMTKMKVLKSNTTEMLQFPGLSRDCNISHFITTRSGGVSQGNYASLNPGVYSGDDPESVRINRKILSEEIGISPTRLFTSYQVHGAEIRDIPDSFLSLSCEEQDQYMYGVDALVTAVPGVCVAVSTADCVPVLVYAPDKKVVAAIHAGWRGTVQQIVAKTIRFMIIHFGCDPSQMQAGIAPSIGCEAFEVGEEVVEAFRGTNIDMSRIMKRNQKTGNPHIDLWEANRIQLLDLGLNPGCIEVAGICTYTWYSDFFSARRLGIKSGRMLSGILIKE